MKRLNSSILGSLPSFLLKISLVVFAFIAICFRDLDTFTIPSSLKYLFISPKIIGTGFTVMESFMDDVTVSSIKDEGTKVVMTKKINLPE